jgi:hypothetical protein
MRASRGGSSTDTSGAMARSAASWRTHAAMDEDRTASSCASRRPGTKRSGNRSLKKLRDNQSSARHAFGEQRTCRPNSRPVTSARALFIHSYTRNGRKTRQPDQLRHRSMAAALAAPERQDQAGEARLRVYVDRREIDRLHLSVAAAVDIEPTIACFQRRADRR